MRTQTGLTPLAPTLNEIVCNLGCTDVKADALETTGVHVRLDSGTSLDMLLNELQSML